MAKIRILLTDDHTLFRQGIRTLLAAENDMEVVGEAGNASDAVALARQTRPDVVLMDIGMAGMSSFEAARRDSQRAPRDPCRLPVHVRRRGLRGRVRRHGRQRVHSEGEPGRSTGHRHPRSASRRQLPESAAAHAAGGRFPHAGTADRRGSRASAL